MTRTFAALGGGLLLGAALTFVVMRTPPAPEPVVRDIADVPKMTAAVAEQHRDTRFADIAGIKDVLALPTEFAQWEALYALAGRSDAAALQGLIFDANRIADDVVREQALSVLFYRLAEADPQSALALARTEYFRGLKAIERRVWHAWARKDFEEALFAAQTQTSTRDGNLAAQSLYAAFGYMGNDITDRIEAELGIGPDRSTRARFLYEMADRSPAEAVRYVDAMPRGIDRSELLSWLAYYLSQSDAVAAETYADLFEDAQSRERFRSIAQSNAAREDPRSTIERLLSGGSASRNRSELFINAIRTLASEDLELTMQYFQQAGSDEDKAYIGSVIASELAKTDPVEALAWARANSKGDRHGQLEMSVLMQIARHDPQLALAEALRSNNYQGRINLVANVMSQIAQEDPLAATGYLEQIDNRQLRGQAAQHLASRWLRDDPDAALDWILTNDDATAQKLLERSSWSLLHSDLDAAISVLPRLAEHQQQNFRMQIAQRLATSRSPAEAQAFVRRFEGDAGYAQLQSSVISGVAQSDTTLARQMADQLADAGARNSAYTAIIQQYAQQNPRAAAAMLASITDERYLGTATAQVATSWYNVEPEAAMRWVAALPPGSQRDDAVMNLAGQWHEATREQQAMIDGIADRDKRGQAKLRQVYNLMRTDPARARQLLEDPDIPSHARQQVELNLKNFSINF